MHVLASVTKIVGLGHTCTKSFVHDVVVTWDETEETSESTAINRLFAAADDHSCYGLIFNKQSTQKHHSVQYSTA